LSDLDQQTLARACRQVQVFGQHHPANLRLAVNVSSQFFRNPAFSQQVIEIVQTTGIHPTCLELEFSESLLLKRTSDTAKRLESLTDLGIRITADHFGSKYESLGLLQQLPLSSVKLSVQTLLAAKNRSAHNYTLVTSTLAVAREMKISVIATGVETTDEIFALEELGCHLAQGHRLVSPMPANAISNALRLRHT
jgi:EAL domain-containing protein (putative c-di-GMP-specific phosphodiesterase class I)